MKLLLDQGLPLSAASLLRVAGMDVIHVEERGMARADDDEILATAREEERAVVTLDADFHARLALSGASLPSVIRIRIEGLRAEPLVALLEAIVQECASDLEEGAAVTVQAERVRVRRLPLISSGG